MRDAVLGEIVGSLPEAGVPYDALMPWKVSNLLLVSSLYDYYTFIEDWRFSEMLLSEYLDLELRFTPSIQRVSTAAEALARLQKERFDLVISMARVGNMEVSEFGRAVRSVNPEVPVVLLACSPREASVLEAGTGVSGVDGLFVWLGDVRLFLAIVKNVEDRRNAWHDACVAGVRSIILVEDSVQFYSSYLPMLYTEIFNQVHALQAASPTRAQKVMRARARPKVLLARCYEEALELYDRHREHLLGVILDAAFPVQGKVVADAGFRTAKHFLENSPGLPILMQSDSRNAHLASEVGLEFIDKNSPTLLGDLRNFMQSRLGFGDFVFQGPDGRVISRVPDLRALEWAAEAVSDEVLRANVARPDFSTWLLARGQAELAETVRRLLDASPAAGALRQALLDAVRGTRQRQVAGVVVDYSARAFESGSGFVRIGDGSLGGKGRGLAFINSLISAYGLQNRFSGISIQVPPTVVLTTEVFDRFMRASGLMEFALQESDDERVTRAFMEHELPRDVLAHLWDFLQWVRYPLAVRSSSLLEDALYQPFAGIYKTFMTPNNADDPETRLEELSVAIQRVYASTYHGDPKAYMASLPNRLEEEKMAVVIQQVVGRSHGEYLYPDLAGVGRSLNFYATGGVKPEDGVVSVALGMGKTVVEGGRCVRFSPRHPRKPIQSFTPAEYIENSQRTFLALDLSQSSLYAPDLVPLDISVAEKHGTLHAVGSVYSPDTDAIYDGISRDGTRLVTMASILKGHRFPLADVTAFLLEVGAAAASCPVEIEFAVNLSSDAREPHQFAFLQLRPLVLGSEAYDVRIDETAGDQAVCVSHSSLGNGSIENVSDVVYVRPERFERAHTAKVAAEVGEMNRRLQQMGRPYLLIGPGRWGSADPWLGIPVKWAQIAGVRCIVETGLSDIEVEPSDGSHFFQNLVSFGIGYLTVDRHRPGDLLDTCWLERQPAETETTFLRHIACAAPLKILLDGRSNTGIVMKPGA
ncbi:MAG: PEP/pyruvate-binding domain-containing protein [Vicinamibacterales bacterium]